MGEAANLRKRRLAFLRRNSRSARATMTVVEHLRELRSRLIISVAAVVATSVLAFVFYRPISEFLLQPLCRLPDDLVRGCRLSTFSPLEGFNVRLKVTAMTGLALAAPVWLYQLWAFIAPGLTVKEKRYALPFVATSLSLFAAGTAFAYALLPAALRFLIQIGGDNVTPLFRAQEYLNFVGLVIIAFGLSFEFPLVLFFLGLAGVISIEQLRRQRKLAIVGIAALSAIVTPTQDPFTMLAMAIPLYLLYELTILLLSVRTRRKSKARSL